MINSSEKKGKMGLVMPFGKRRKRKMTLQSEWLTRFTGMILAFVLLFSMLGSRSYAAFYLPEHTLCIEDEAFRGLQTDSLVELPEGLTEIGSCAFADGAFQSIYLPASIQSIAPDAFQGMKTPVLIRTVPNSAGVSFALSHQLDFKAETVLRALLIGQAAYPNGYMLNGPKKDLVTMGGLLRDYKVTERKDLTAQEILDAIPEAFADAKAEDISLFYYSGHGLFSDNPEENGALRGIDLKSNVTGAQLRRALDAIPGRKIVILDACYSGGFLHTESDVTIGEDTTFNQPEPLEKENPAAGFIRSFTSGPSLLRSSQALQQYFIMASSAGDERSWEATYGGVFTRAFAASRNEGDLNGDGVVSFEEAHTFTAQEVTRVVSAEGLTQSVLAFPDACYWFGMFR